MKNGLENYRLSFPGCFWMSSNRYFLANNINPFMGLLGLSQSFSFFTLAGEGGGGECFVADEVGGAEWGTAAADEPKTKAEPPALAPVIARGEVKSSAVAAGEENSKRLKRSHKSGVRMASGWFGGKQMSPTERSWQRMPYLFLVAVGLSEHQPNKNGIKLDQM